MSRKQATHSVKSVDVADRSILPSFLGVDGMNGPLATTSKGPTIRCILFSAGLWLDGALLIQFHALEVASYLP